MGNNFNRRIKEISNNNQLKISPICSRSSRITDIAKSKANKLDKRCKKNNCVICGKIGPIYNCNDMNVVYNFQCDDCKERYIGKTDSSMNQRYYQHRMANNRNDGKNPLVRHTHNNHPHKNNDINNFKLEILDSYKNDPVATAVGEAPIENLKPEINKKRECRTLFS